MGSFVVCEKVASMDLTLDNATCVGRNKPLFKKIRVMMERYGSEDSNSGEKRIAAEKEPSPQKKNNPD